jgi:hypothetical protein
MGKLYANSLSIEIAPGMIMLKHIDLEIKSG